ncbi:putative E3 ubiquitin-protein ligase XBAT35 isoform X1 [Prunus yedoensis var. nudiflora]|uniref:Putative E3 ubiquitin-protein ligase XBAT35 isoform X1 n=1 Tax=Prunus yedoensis var. nudiflora TaxID=2094558 RepID=A0A314Y8W0_PRUYE|nr:putative E3 ubiquitin-protein ligase XBAT35 isoform X1 [Prunus yedoensis var. nudiflora]
METSKGSKPFAEKAQALSGLNREGKTPLILACINPGLYNVAKSLIELGANVNAYRPGRNAGTPLHHAAKKGLEDVVNLLLSHGANVLIMNDDCQTPLDVARAKGHTNVVRAIEVIQTLVCNVKAYLLFSGWLREFYGPGFLEVLAPLLVSRKVWVVVLPSGSRKPTMPFKLELAIYSSMQDARPRTVVALWKVNLEEPKLHQSDPSVVIHDSSTIPRGRRRRRSIYISQEARCRHQKVRQTRIKLASADENDKQQLQWFCNACKGIPQARPGFLANNQPPVVPATAPPPAEDLELTMAINASIQSALQDRPSFPDAHLTYEATAAPNASSSSERPGNESGQKTEIQGISSIQTAPTSDIIPSAPPVADEEPIHYPSIDFSPIDMPSPSVESIPLNLMKRKIKAKKWGCPVCRAKIDQIVRLYAV